MLLRSLLLVCVLWHAQLAVGMHKCVDADGNVTYSQTACEQSSADRPDGPQAPGAVSAGHSVSASGQAESRCDHVRGFALELAEAMRHGVQLDQAVAILGGRTGPAGILGDDTLEIANYVYAFAGRGAGDPARVADSTVEYCRRGKFAFDAGAPGDADRLPRESGSGILLSPQGMVLTVDRLVAACRSLRLYREGAWYEAQLLRREPDLDLAILVAQGLRGRPAVLADAAESQAGPLLAASLPLRGVLMGRVSLAEVAEAPGTADVAASRGLAAGTASGAAPAQDAGVEPLLHLTSGSAQAGAPLLTSSGLVAGMALATAEEGAPLRLMWTRALRRFLDAANIDYYSASGLGELNREELRRRAAGFTVHLACLP
jgi:hypothetical protein